MIEKGSSLLPKGVTGLDGSFDAGSVVNISFNGTTFARGISPFSSQELVRVIGLGTPEIKKIFPDRKHCEAVHRDSLVLL